MSQTDTTLVPNAVHNPAEPRHFMRIKPVARRIVFRLGDEVLAETTRAVRVLEAGKDLYDPVYYIPPSDVTATLRRNDHTSHCPLKGDAAYFDLVDAGGEIRQPGIAWCYPEPIECSAELAGLIAFYTDRVSIEEAPL